MATTAIPTECVIGSVRDDHESAANQSDENLRSVRWKVISPIGAAEARAKSDACGSPLLAQWRQVRQWLLQAYDVFSLPTEGNELRQRKGKVALESAGNGSRTVSMSRCQSGPPGTRASGFGGLSQAPLGVAFLSCPHPIEG